MSAALLLSVIAMTVMSAMATEDSPTFWPTVSPGWQDTHHAYFAATWNPNVAPFHDPSGNWIFMMDTWKHDGGMVNCSSFSDEHCTTKIKYDTPFYTDETLSTEISGPKTFMSYDYSGLFIAEKDNGDEVVVSVWEDGDVYHCSWYGEYRIIDDDDRETCYRVFDLGSAVVASTQDSFGKVLLITSNELLRCDVSGAETDSNVACESVTDLSSVSSQSGLAISDDETEIFLSNSNGVYRGVIDSISNSAISITWDLVNKYVDMDYLEEDFVNDEADDDFRLSSRDGSMIHYHNESLYVLSGGWTSVLVQCTDVDDCTKIPYMSKYGGAQYRFRDDDGGSALAGPRGLLIVDDCIVAMNYAEIEMWCPNGLPANTMPAAVAATATDDEETSSGPLIATSTLTGVLGLGLMGACFYIYTLRVERAAYQKGIHDAPEAGHHEMTTA